MYSVVSSVKRLHRVKKTNGIFTLVTIEDKQIISKNVICIIQGISLNMGEGLLCKCIVGCILNSVWGIITCEISCMHKEGFGLFCITRLTSRG
jgi:hypothetical protein